MQTASELARATATEGTADPTPERTSAVSDDMGDVAESHRRGVRTDLLLLALAAVASIAFLCAALTFAPA
jgi:hypothetical protein